MFARSPGVGEAAPGDLRARPVGAKQRVQAAADAVLARAELDVDLALRKAGVRARQHQLDEPVERLAHAQAHVLLDPRAVVGDGRLDGGDHLVDQAGERRLEARGEAGIEVPPGGPQRFFVRLLSFRHGTRVP